MLQDISTMKPWIQFLGNSARMVVTWLLGFMKCNFFDLLLQPCLLGFGVHESHKCAKSSHDFIIKKLATSIIYSESEKQITHLTVVA
jgi:hypothetical protein